MELKRVNSLCTHELQRIYIQRMDAIHENHSLARSLAHPPSNKKFAANASFLSQARYA